MGIHDVARYDREVSFARMSHVVCLLPPRTGNVGQETQEQVDSVRQADAGRRCQGEVHQPRLADQAGWVQDDESAVSVRYVSFPSF